MTEKNIILNFHFDIFVVSVYPVSSYKYQIKLFTNIKFLLIAIAFFPYQVHTLSSINSV